MSGDICAWCMGPIGVDRIRSVDLQAFVHYSKIDCAEYLLGAVKALRERVAADKETIEDLKTELREQKERQS